MAMKLAFSTLGCPDWSLRDIVGKGAQYGFDAIDFRGVQRTVELTRVPAFAPKAISETADFISSHGLHVCGISTSARLYVPGDDSPWWQRLGEAAENVELARSLGASYVRVFVGQLQEQGDRGSARQEIIRNYRELCRHVEGSDVLVLIETHDDWCNSSELAEIIDAVDHRLAGVVWDILHPLSVEGESFHHTVTALGGRIKLVHVKDFKRAGETCSYATIGTGELDPAELVGELRNAGYEGYLVLELPKLHRSDLPEPEETFPRYVEMMKPHIG
jgi:sugar phosphate isomerase/epimerase